MIPFNTELEKEELEKVITGRYSVVLPNIKPPKYSLKSIDGPFGSRYDVEKRFGYYNGEWWYQVSQWNKTTISADKQYTYYASESDLEAFEAAIKLSKTEEQLREETKREQNIIEQEYAKLEKTRQEQINQILQKHNEKYKYSKISKPEYPATKWNASDFDTNKFGEW